MMTQFLGTKIMILPLDLLINLRIQYMIGKTSNLILSVVAWARLVCCFLFLIVQDPNGFCYVSTFKKTNKSGLVVVHGV